MGGPFRAATRVFGSSAESRTIANRPRSCASARLAAASRPSPRISRSTMCAMISVSVSGTKRGAGRAVSCHSGPHHVRDYFGVGLGDESVALLLQLSLELQVVLDDAVVDDDEPAGAVAVRMRVFFSGPSVRRPPRVPETVRP